MLLAIAELGTAFVCSLYGGTSQTCYCVLSAYQKWVSRMKWYILIAKVLAAGDRCPKCHGNGQLVCNNCEGRGFRGDVEWSCSSVYGAWYQYLLWSTAKLKLFSTCVWSKLLRQQWMSNFFGTFDGCLVQALRVRCIVFLPGVNLI